MCRDQTCKHALVEQHAQSFPSFCFRVSLNQQVDCDRPEFAFVSNFVSAMR